MRYMVPQKEQTTEGINRREVPDILNISVAKTWPSESGEHGNNHAVAQNKWLEKKHPRA
jgi:hypothetical protein